MKSSKERSYNRGCFFFFLVVTILCISFELGRGFFIEEVLGGGEGDRGVKGEGSVCVSALYEERENEILRIQMIPG